MNVTIYSNDNSIDWGVTGEYRIVQNVHNILRTRRFEVPFMRDMGINDDLLDTNSARIKAEFISHIRDVIKTYENRANVIDVRIESCNEDGEYVIAIDLEV